MIHKCFKRKNLNALWVTAILHEVDFLKIFAKITIFGERRLLEKMTLKFNQHKLRKFIFFLNYSIRKWNLDVYWYFFKCF